MDQIVAALRGHATWVRNYAIDPKKYHQPSCSAETYDLAADEIERLRAILQNVALAIGHDDVPLANEQSPRPAEEGK